MLEGGRISEAELVTMLMFTVLGTAFFFLPSVAAGFAGRDAWLTVIPATLAALAVAWACGCLTTRFPGFNFFNWMEILLGTAGGKILQFLYILWFIDVTETIAAEFAYFMNIAFLPRTPSLMLTALLLFLAGVAVYGGAEMIGRLAIVFLPVSLVIFLGMFALAGGLYDFSNLRPFLEKGLTPVVVGSLTPGAWRGEVLLGAMFFPLLARPERGGRLLTRSILWIGLLMLVDALALTMAFGDETARLSQPLYSLAREINLLSFFQHLESLVLISWVASVFVKAAVWYYVTVLGLGQWLNLKSYRPMVLPAGLLMLAVAGYNWPNIATMAHFVATVVPFYSGGTFEFAIPLLLAVWALIQSRKAA
ncbi:MAG TPA: endospore germination permease [Spirochaetia bacterium]|nr:endospore germination permease [Spirochaetia bacterium]